MEVEEINPAPSGEIGFNKATFTWSNAEDGSLTPSRRRFALRIEDQLTFRRGCVNLIVGPTGSGKTSLLMALLGLLILVALMGADNYRQVRCTTSPQTLTLGSTFLGTTA